MTTPVTTSWLRDLPMCGRCGMPAGDSDHGYLGTHSWRPDTLRDAAERLVAAGPHPTPLNDTWAREWDALRAALAASPADSSDLDVAALSGALHESLVGCDFTAHRDCSLTQHPIQARNIANVYRAKLVENDSEIVR